MTYVVAPNGRILDPTIQLRSVCYIVDQFVIDVVINQTRILKTRCAFAALKGDGSEVSWGRRDQGGVGFAVQSQLRSDVQQIFNADPAFVALKVNGSIVSCEDHTGR